MNGTASAPSPSWSLARRLKAARGEELPRAETHRCVAIEPLPACVLGPWADGQVKPITLEHVMTVAELIEELRSLPSDLPVLVEGYETGWDGIHSMRELGVESVPNANDWDGEFREALELGQSVQPAVLLVGRRGSRR